VSACTRRTAFGTAIEEIDDCYTLTRVIKAKLDELQQRAGKDTSNWSYAAAAAHARNGLEEILIAVSPKINGKSEDENHREARRQAGINVTREWEK